MSSQSLVEDRVFQGIDRLLRIDVCNGSTEQALDSHYKKHVDCFELLEAFEIFHRFVLDTKDMIGKPKYHTDGPEFDFVEELMQDMKSYYYGVKDFIPDEEIRKNKGKYSKMFTFVFEPLIKLYQNSMHEDAIGQYEALTERCIDFIMHSDSEASIFDAMVVGEILKKEYKAILQRRATTTIAEGILRLRRRKRKKKRTV